MLLPGKGHEDCRLLDAGQGMAYRFTADAPLEFNVHRHDGETVISPVQIARAKALDAIFDADVRAEWCWMWVNRGREPVRLEVKVGV
ncbi:hypothetical protein OPU71_18780 [Niveibacterium sp. 24ML]|uniref:hypothetical protein n=1 Tax=Niveibacterium sp. 24ML TaxID=2985512 RepID=UPI00226FD97B|nr:hypothetical protein [Niveibacterium sp. 24ML]MCX9158173.1 hypothetical protein [Niveibacterium sp. 24ML]